MPPWARPPSRATPPQGDSLNAVNDVALMTVNALGPLWIYKKMKPMLEQKTEKTKLIFLSSVDGGVAAFPHFTLSDGLSGRYNSI